MIEGQKVTPELGTISHGTMRPEDLIPAFASELDRLDPDGRGDLIKEANGFYEIDDDDRDPADGDADDLLDELFDALNDCAPAGAYFGAHEGDGSDYGFWESREL